MKPSQAVLVLMGLLAGWPAQAATITIVDTGQGTGMAPVLGTSVGQWLAAEFFTSQPWEITGLEGWIAPRGRDGDAGDVTFALYSSDGGDVPGTELFSQALALPSSGDAAWYGPTSLSWLLATGTYWAVFEVRSGSSFSGSMPGESPNPLINEAFAKPPATYIPFDDLDLGVRISAFQEDSVGGVVPEPTSLLLLGTGALGLLAMARRRRKQQK